MFSQLFSSTVAENVSAELAVVHRLAGSVSALKAKVTHAERGI